MRLAYQEFIETVIRHQDEIWPGIYEQHHLSVLDHQQWHEVLLGTWETKLQQAFPDYMSTERMRSELARLLKRTHDFNLFIDAKVEIGLGQLTSTVAEHLASCYKAWLSKYVTVPLGELPKMMRYFQNLGTYAEIRKAHESSKYFGAYHESDEEELNELRDFLLAYTPTVKENITLPQPVLT